ncbi:MAG: glutaredoxin family protein [Solirubrobacterales bacterium]
MKVTLYSRQGCHLCDDAREEILRIVDGSGEVVLRELDIEADEGLLRTYLERIPVVEVDGRVVSELIFDGEAFRRALHTVDP